MLQYRRQASPLGGLEHPLDGMDEATEVIPHEPQPEIHERKRGAHESPFAGKAENKQPQSPLGRGPDERVVVRIAADHAIHHDCVGVRQAGLGNEVTDLSLDPLLDPVLAGELDRRLLVFR